MATIPDMDGVIYSTLVANAGVLAQVSTRIYARMAPPGAALPYLVFDVPSGILPNIVPRDMMDYVFRVHSWGNSRAQSANAHGAVFGALHETTLTITGWTNTWTACERATHLAPEEVDGEQFWHSVWDVRVRASRNSL